MISKLVSNFKLNHNKNFKIINPKIVYLIMFFKMLFNYSFKNQNINEINK